MTPDKVEEIVEQMLDRSNCPLSCDGYGTYVEADSHGDPIPAQCQWCYENVMPQREKFIALLTKHHQDLTRGVVEKCINEVNCYRATPRLRRDFCEWCDEVLLPGDKCDCKTETVRQELMHLINMDLEALTKAQIIIK